MITLKDKMIKINFYKTEKNHCPVEEFLETLNDKQVDKVFWVFDLVEELDQVPKEYLKKLISTDDLWEIRVQQGSNAYRFLGFFEKDELIILNHAFSKKTQKTPRKEINTAERRKAEYYKSKGKK
jgi:phage-related protein